MTNRRTELADPALALVSYLDELLHTATSADREEDDRPGQGPDVASPDAVENLTVAPAPAPEPELPARGVVSKPAQKPAIAETVSPAVDQPSWQPPPEAPAERPPWSRKPFECLIFKVAGLQLAVPLVLLGAIHRIEDKVKPIPGRPPWYMGMLLDRSQNLKVVDSAEWIMAGRVPEKAREGYRFVIRLDDSDWGLACDEVAESFTLDPAEVRWRSSLSKRPWLAGTVVKHMCALVDVGTMARLLVRAEHEHRLEIE